MKKCYWCGIDIKFHYFSERVDGAIQLFCSEKCRDEVRPKKDKEEENDS